jgi:hypothetical protein
MIDKIRTRLAADEGDAAAKANIRAAIPTAEAYYADNGTYLSMNVTAMKTIDQGVSPTLEVKVYGGGTGYCLADHNGSSAFYVQRGSLAGVAYGGQITAGAGAGPTWCP